MRKKDSTTPRTPNISVEVGHLQVYGTIRVGNDRVGRVWMSLYAGAEDRHPGLTRRLSDAIAQIGQETP